MPDESPRSHLHLKNLAKQHWKAKIFSRDDGQGKTDDEKLRLNEKDVADFLRPSVRKPSASSGNGSQVPQLGRLDTSSARRWPSATEINQRIASVQETASSDPGPRSTSLGRPCRKRGLTVHFTDRQPELIGEGGDDAEEPPMEVARSRGRPLMPFDACGGSQPDIRRPDNGDEMTVHGRMVAPDVPRRKPLASDAAPRAEQWIGLQNPPQGIESHSAVVQDALGDPASEYIGLIDADMGKPATPDHRAEARAAMRAEEGRALINMFSQVSIEDGETSLRGSMEEAPSNNGITSHQRPSFSDDPTPSSTHSMLLPSSTPSSVNHLAHLPPILSPRKGSEVTVPEQAQPRLVTAKFPGPGTMNSPALQSWRQATSALGDNAIELFSSRVEHLSRIFQLAADSVKPASGTTLAEWVRAALWWFMKGRAELEKAIRNYPRSSVNQDAEVAALVPSRQTFVDLAKAWWIISDIIPQHSEVRRYGDGKIESLIGVARSCGDGRLAELIELHQAIRHKFGALTKSMKRNNFLPPDADEPLLAQGLSTAIWVAYPMLTPEICAVLSGNASRSLVVQAPLQSQPLGDIMPLGDSTRYFNYGRMFIDIVLRHDDNPTQEVKLPCVLSILRERVNWQIKVVIASQNELVNISVQSDKRFGPTWDDVRWHNKQESLTIRLAARGFSLHVVFRDGDFKILSRLYDQTQNLQTCLQPEEDEELIFTNIVRSFQYTNPDPKSTSFPPEPVIRCRLSLFEKRVSHAEGTGIRRLYRGHRLVVVTSPKTKNLSSSSERVGYNQAIEFGLVRGEEDLPGLFLKIRHEEKLSNLVFTFHEANERIQFLSVLQCNFVQEHEVVLADMAFKSLSVEEKSQADTFGRSSGDIFKDFNWKRLRVINKDPDNPDFAHGQTIRRENLRICAEAAFGSVTDRVNLGKYISMQCGAVL